MDLNNLNCPQFVNFDSSEFLSTEFSSLSLDAPDWSDSAKKSNEASLIKDRKIEQKENLESHLKKEKLPVEKGNQISKAKAKCKDVKSTVGGKRKLFGCNTGGKTKSFTQNQAMCKRTDLPPFKQLEPILPAQLCDTKRFCVEFEFGDNFSSSLKSPHKKLDVKTTQPAPEALDSKVTVPKIKNNPGVRDPLFKTTENSRSKARRVPHFVLTLAKSGAEHGFQEGGNEIKEFVFALPKVEPSSQPQPFRFGLEKDSKIASKEFTTFKARPATVLKNKPFIPTLPPKVRIRVQEISLHTQKRADERCRRELLELTASMKKLNVDRDEKVVQEFPPPAQKRSERRAREKRCMKEIQDLVKKLIADEDIKRIRVINDILHKRLLQGNVPPSAMKKEIMDKLGIS